MKHRILAFHVLLTLMLATFSASAEEIEERLSNGLLAGAEYQAGDLDKPAILLIHGFLTVHSFNLIQSITTEIAGNQYAVLAPTLTLGISKRKTTLECNALHLHSMDNDLKEIDWWVNWLVDKGYKKIILMGHSSGAVQVVSYADTYKNKKVTRLIALSIIPLLDPNNSHAVMSYQKALTLVEQQNTDIHNFTLTYCIENYAAPAKMYLSYAQWDASRILKALHSIKIDKQMIIGSHDISKSFNLVEDLKTTDIKIDTIEGADHFFGSGTELELYDTILLGISRK